MRKIRAHDNQQLTSCDCGLSRRYFGSWIANTGVVPDRYQLRKGVFGVPSRSREKGVITIPPGSIVEVHGTVQAGILSIVWERQPIWVFGIDLQEAGELLGHLPQ